jgi:ADP-heptose:LPS heptosyltransferase
LSYAQRITIIHRSSSRMLLWAMPMINSLRGHFPNAHITIITSGKNEELLSSCREMDHYHFVDGCWQIIQLLWRKKPDFIIDIEKRSYIRIISNLIRSQYLKPDFKNKKHFADNFIELVRNLGAATEFASLSHLDFKDSEPRSFKSNAPASKDYAVLILGGKKCNQLTFEKGVELLDRINKPVILLGGKSEIELAERLTEFFKRSENSDPFEEGLNALGKKTVVINECGQNTLSESIFWVKNSSYVFGGDTLLTHIAASFKKPLFTFWGSTSPIKSYPIDTYFHLFENQKLECHPCSSLGRDRCPKGHFKCIKKLNFDFYIPE